MNTDHNQTLKELADYKYALDQSAIVSITDENGIIKYVNDNFCNLFGYTKEEAIGHNHSIINSAHHPPAFWKHFWDTIQKGEVLKTEVLNRSKQGDLYWGQTTIVPFLNETGKPYQYLAIRTDITEKRELEKELEEQKLKQQKLITEVAIQAQEKQRDQLGKEMHDNINQLLATSKLYLGMIKMDGKNDEFLEVARHYIDNAIQEIRKLSRSLVAPTLSKLTLPEAIKELIETIETTTLLDIELLTNDYHDEMLSHDIKLMLYRIVQEQLNNILKHAQAQKVQIRLSTFNNNIVLVVQDDGKGFDTSKTPNGIGLKNITTRAEFYGGSVLIISSPGTGCNLKVNIPLLQVQVA